MHRSSDVIALPSARPGAAEATDCKVRADAQSVEEQTYVRGKDALQKGDLETAYQEFERLPEQSLFRARPEVAQATVALARSRLNDARGLLPNRLRRRHTRFTCRATPRTRSANPASSSRVAISSTLLIFWWATNVASEMDVMKVTPFSSIPITSRLVVLPRTSGCTLRGPRCSTTTTPP